MHRFGRAAFVCIVHRFGSVSALLSHQNAVLGRSTLLAPDVSYASLQGLITFCGNGQSGTTLVGSVLDAHPKIILANEYDEIRRSHDADGHLVTADELYSSIARKAKRKAKMNIGGGLYNYSMADQWQGRTDGDPLLIGGKRVGSESSAECIQGLRDLAEITQLPIKIILVHRNPYDVIASLAFKETLGLNTFERVLYEKVEEDLEELGDYADYAPPGLPNAITDYFYEEDQCRELLRAIHNGSAHIATPTQVISVVYEELLADPGGRIRRLCDQLAIECDDDYIGGVEDLVATSDHYPRLDISFGGERICDIAQRCMEDPLLRRYMVPGGVPWVPVTEKQANYVCRDQCFPGTSPCSCKGGFPKGCPNGTVLQ